MIDVVIITIIIIISIIYLTCEVTRMDHMVKRVLELQIMIMASSPC